MTHQELRRLFLQYFSERGHVIVPSGSLIPANNPSLLFTNAGMVPFKDVFLGLETRPYKRAVSIQRCLRVGGKHNDLENVGYTERHHTFFEMLGNFSFGDYFKREAIAYAWEFLTQVLGVPREKLWVTVFTEDKEAADIWMQEQCIDPSRFSRCGAQDNFWSMGEIGPCGPCSEIFYDYGPQVLGGPPGSPGAEGDRYVEIWNLVFMQYQRNAEGDLLPLQCPSVDTGIGLERLAAVMQGVVSNYATDLFQPLIQTITQLAGLSSQDQVSVRVIADHIRATAFLLAEGVLPSNEGRGYVLRRIIRRAVRHGYQLGLQPPFFFQLMPILTAQMQETYPELRQNLPSLSQILKQEEEQFSHTLSQGIKLFTKQTSHLTNSVIPGSVVFRLYDTYGFPPDLTADIARERGLKVDIVGFEKAMTQRRQQSRAASSFSRGHEDNISEKVATYFVGYDCLSHAARVVGLLQNNQATSALPEGEMGMVALDCTPFYAEGGGQVGDQGCLIANETEFLVQDTRRIGKIYWHMGQLIKGKLNLGMELEAQVEISKRQAIRKNHSATHLLHAALRDMLGNQVEQKGSLVAVDRLRFDFSYPSSVSRAQIKKIEQLVNQKIGHNLLVETIVMPLAEAQKTGALAFFGEQYGEQVRVLTMGDFSKELCAGTHVKRTGDIGLFKVLAEASVAAGIRRIEALTGSAALMYVSELEETLQAVTTALTTHRGAVLSKLQKTLHQIQTLEKKVIKLEQNLIQMKRDELCRQAISIGDIKLVATLVQELTNPALRSLADQIKNTLGKSVVLLAVVSKSTVHCIVAVSRECVNVLDARELAEALAKKLQGRGGGRLDFAQIGGGNADYLDEAFCFIKNWIQKRIVV